MEDLRNTQQDEVMSVYVRSRVNRETKISWACDTYESLLEIVYNEMAGWYQSQYHGRLYCVADRHGVVRFYDKSHRRFYPFNDAKDS